VGREVVGSFDGNRPIGGARRVGAIDGTTNGVVIGATGEGERVVGAEGKDDEEEDGAGGRMPTQLYAG
jgi:hypothetical protein